ncbi:MAG TPA: tRNA (adenosine(37)-N6)-threonylcarbamoyltransferase complex dimerization subunit type 1 TsaB [Candidatus Faecousia intestinigallinarum]|nr:tRNA (adenosine(37)-N6)-threonylcarbamoyltransferase complex dimerization subunit type 1 TsaB [Candidatus Faecousia intestinigallinarum]
MLLLSFETSAKAAGAALHDGEKLLGETYQNTGLTHSQTLLVMAEDLLRQCGRTPGEVTAAAVAAGPGSFTGVRIGTAAAKGFAWGKNIPCYGVSTLEAMALGLGVFQGCICPVMDARRQQVYTALFHADCGKYTRLRQDEAISLQELEGILQNLREPIFLVGDGADLCYNTLSERVPGLVLPPEHRRHQRASGVALAALARIAAGDPGDGLTLKPNYLRLSQAERERLAKETSQGEK